MLQVMVVGLGPMGAGCAQAIRDEADLRLVSLFDTDPRKIGKSAIELLGSEEELEVGRPGGPRVTDDPEQALAGKPDVAVVTTSSRFDEVAPIARYLLKHGIAVLSSCEQMAWPWYRHAELAEQLDAEARAAGLAVLGTGVNPGFAMDALPVTLASMVRRVSRVRCVRRVNTALRRPQLQRKLGATLSPEKFHQRAEAGEVGHVGLGESLALLAAGLGRSVEPGSIDEQLHPVLAETPTASSLGLITPGSVAGARHLATWRDTNLVIELELTMAVGLTDPVDRVKLEGPVQLCLKIPGSVPGDSATVATLLNHITTVASARPGLRTMLDVPPSGCHNRDRPRKAPPADAAGSA